LDREKQAGRSVEELSWSKKEKGAYIMYRPFFIGEDMSRFVLRTRRDYTGNADCGQSKIQIREIAMTNHKLSLGIVMLALGLSACQPTDRPTNLANKPALDKAKAVEGQLQQRAADGQRKADEEQK
jgi:hypothetical protein